MHFDIFTIFPNMFRGPLDESILRRAMDRQIVSVAIHDIREWTSDRHRSVDDYPYGGGPGMVMMAPPIVAAVESVLAGEQERVPVYILSPAGQRLDQSLAREIAQKPRIALVCGRYEGIDDRVRQVLSATEISIGDYVMTGGELGAMVIIDVVSRLVPGVIDEESLAEESHSSGLLEAPHYTRPNEFRGLRVPDILLSGHHANVTLWRRQQALLRTLHHRPDLIRAASLSPEDVVFLRTQKETSDPS